MPKLVEVDLSSVYEDLKTVGEHINEQVRSLALGLIVLVWLFLTGPIADRPVLAHPISDRTLVAIAVLSLMGLICNYLQYFFGYLNSRKIQLDAEAAGRTKVSYDYTASRYRLRNMFFWLKQGFVLYASAWFLFALSRSLF